MYDCMTLLNFRCITCPPFFLGQKSSKAQYYCDDRVKNLLLEELKEASSTSFGSVKLTRRSWQRMAIQVVVSLKSKTRWLCVYVTTYYDRYYGSFSIPLQRLILDARVEAFRILPTKRFVQVPMTKALRNSININ